MSIMVSSEARAYPQGYSYLPPAGGEALVVESERESSRVSETAIRRRKHDLHHLQHQNGQQNQHYSVPDYAFKYDVDDSSSGNYYGHAEARQGTRTEGRLVFSCNFVLQVK